MAIIPTKDNFQVMPTGLGARFDNGPRPVDPSVNAQKLSSGLMAASRIADENDKTEAMMRANEWGDYTSKALLNYKSLKGYNAYKNEDGALVLDSLKQDFEQRKSEMMGNMSPQQAKYFELHTAHINRAFVNGTQDHFNTEHRAWVDTTDKQTQENEGKGWLLDGNDDNLNNYRAVSIKRHLRDGMDDSQAILQANKDASGLIEKRIDFLLDNKKQDEAKTALERYKPYMTGDDFIKVAGKVDSYIRTQQASDYGVALANGGGGGITVNSDVEFKRQRFSVESSGGKTNADGTPLVNRSNRNGTIDVGRYQLNSVNWESAASAAGETLDRDRMLKDSAYADRLGEAWVDKVFLPEAKAAFGNDWMKIHAAYNVGVQGVKNRVKTHGARWRDVLPDVTKNQLAALEKSGNATATPEQRRVMVHEKYKNDPESERIALNEMTIQDRVRKESNDRMVEENMAGILRLIGNGAGAAEIQKVVKDANLTAGNEKRVWDFYNNRGEVKTNWNLFHDFITDGAKLVKADLGAYVDQFATDQLKELAERQKELKFGKGKDYAGKLQHESLLKRMSVESGLGKWDKLSSEKQAQIRSFLYWKEKEITARNGKFTEDDAIREAQNAFRTVPVGEGWWGDKTQVFAAMTPEERFGHEVMLQGGETEKNATAVYDKYFYGRGDVYDTIKAMLKKEGRAVNERNMVIRLFKLMDKEQTALFTLKD